MKTGFQFYLFSKNIGLGLIFRQQRKILRCCGFLFKVMMKKLLEFSFLISVGYITCFYVRYSVITNTLNSVFTEKHLYLNV